MQGWAPLTLTVVHQAGVASWNTGEYQVVVTLSLRGKGLGELSQIWESSASREMESPAVGGIPFSHVPHTPTEQPTLTANAELRTPHNGRHQTSLLSYPRQSSPLGF